VGEKSSISHDIIGHHGASRVLLKPAVEGKGIIASNNVRAVVELAGIRNIYSKNLGSNNPLNVVRATIDGLTNTRTRERTMYLRKGIKPQQ
jgi:small subunit ribosomal protein S5